MVLLRYFSILAIVLSWPAWAVDRDDPPSSTLAEFGDTRWWCPASNWGKSELEWPEDKQDDVARIRNDTNTYVSAYNYDRSSKYRQIGQSVGRFEMYWWDGRNNKYKMSVCTASIVAEDHIIANRHCVTDDDGGATLVKAQIRMGYLGSKSPGTLYKVEIKSIDISKSLDYALLGVYGSPFTHYKKLKFKPRDPGPKEKLFMIQHPAGLSQKVVTGCTAQTWDIESGDRGFMHSCSSEGGSSGSPIFSEEDNSIVGLHYASVKSIYRHRYSSPYYKFAKRGTRIANNSSDLRAVTYLNSSADRVQWTVIGSSGKADGTQSWAVRNSLTEAREYIDEKYKNNYSIHDINYSRKAKKWAVIMAQNSKAQAYSVESSWDKTEDWIKQKRKSHYYVTNATYGEGKYFVVMNYEPEAAARNGFHSWNSSFPKDEMIDARKKGWNVKELLFDYNDEEKPYLVFYRTSATKQTWTWHVSKSWPSDKIEEYRQSGYVIDRAIYAGNEWVIFFGWYQNVSAPWATRHYLPEVRVRELWDSKYSLYQLVPGG